MTTTTMLAVLAIGLVPFAASVTYWLYAYDRLPWLAVLVQRYQVFRAERLCRRDERMCEICANRFVQDLFPEDIWRAEP